MINRQNWLDIKAFLKFQKEVKQVHPLSAQAQWSRLRHLLEWAEDKPFGKVAKIRPTFPAFAEALVNEQENLLSASSLNAIFKTSRTFFNWAQEEYPSRYKAIDQSWVQSLRPSRGRSENAELHTRKLYTLNDVLKLIAVPAETVAQRRLRAAVAFLFLSGMRIGAFVTLPIKCVDIGGRQVVQAPALGVHTKNSKAAVTYLLNIPQLLEVVKEWDKEVRAALPEDAYWYAHLDQFGELTAEKPNGNRDNVRHDFRDELVEMCQMADVEYLSPHKLRHGFAVYALKRAKTPAQMKAVSQNLMHSNIGITDEIYAKLVNDDVRDLIGGL